MGIFSEKKPYTAISSETETLLMQGSQPDLATLMNLLELINGTSPASAGGHECGRLLRKKLKHGSAIDQLRAIALIEMIVDNGVSTKPFVIESGLVDQLVQLAASHEHRTDLSKEAKAARRCRTLLQNWAARTDPNIASLFSRAGLVNKHDRTRSRRSVHVDDDLDNVVFGPGHQRSTSTGSWGSGHLVAAPPAKPARPQSQIRASARPNQSIPRSRSPSPLNIRGSSVDTLLATSHNTATKLTTSVIESPYGSVDTQTYSRQAKQLRHKLVQLIHDPDPEVQVYVGQLLSANEELVTALQAHDAVIKAGEQLEMQNDHDEFDLQALRRPEVEPVRSPPSPHPPTDSESDFEELERPKTDPFDPFGDDNEQVERPKHTPMW